MQMNKYLRKVKNRWVYPKFQLQVVAYGLTIGLINLFLTWIAIEIFFQRSAETLLRTGAFRLNFLATYIGLQKNQMILIYVGLFFSTLIISAIVGLLLSHRAAGPLYRFRRHFEEIKNGVEPGPIRFRGKDFFQDLAAVYNETLKKPDSKVETKI